MGILQRCQKTNNNAEKKYYRAFLARSCDFGISLSSASTESYFFARARNVALRRSERSWTSHRLTKKKQQRLRQKKRSRFFLCLLVILEFRLVVRRKNAPFWKASEKIPTVAKNARCATCRNGHALCSSWATKYVNEFDPCQVAHARRNN